MAEDIGPKPQDETEDATQYEDETEETDDSSGQGPITALKVFAYVNLVGGIIIGAFVIWASVGSRSVLGSPYVSEANPFGIVLGAVFLAEGIFGCALLLVIAGMAENLIAIRQNTEDLLEFEEDHEDEEHA